MKELVLKLASLNLKAAIATGWTLCWGRGLCLILVGISASSCALFVDDGFTDGLDRYEVLHETERYQLSSTDDYVKPVEAYEPPRDAGTLVIYNMFADFHMADAWLRSDREGEVWLKVYEVSTGALLSADKVKAETKTRVEKVADADPSVARRVEMPEFFVFEGDAGRNYFARIELWFKSSSYGELVLLSDVIVEFEGHQH